MSELESVKKRLDRYQPLLIRCMTEALIEQFTTYHLAARSHAQQIGKTSDVKEIYEKFQDFCKHVQHWDVSEIKEALKLAKEHLKKDTSTSHLKDLVTTVVALSSECACLEGGHRPGKVSNVRTSKFVHKVFIRVAENVAYKMPQLFEPLGEGASPEATKTRFESFHKCKEYIKEELETAITSFIPLGKVLSPVKGATRRRKPTGGEQPPPPHVPETPRAASNSFRPLTSSNSTSKFAFVASPQVSNSLPRNGSTTSSTKHSSTQAPQPPQHPTSSRIGSQQPSNSHERTRTVEREDPNTAVTTSLRLNPTKHALETPQVQETDGAESYKSVRERKATAAIRQDDTRASRLANASTPSLSVSLPGKSLSSSQTVRAASVASVGSLGSVRIPPHNDEVAKPTPPPAPPAPVVELLPERRPSTRISSLVRRSQTSLLPTSPPPPSAVEPPAPAKTFSSSMKTSSGTLREPEPKEPIKIEEFPVELLQPLDPLQPSELPDEEDHGYTPPPSDTEDDSSSSSSSSSSSDDDRDKD